MSKRSRQIIKRLRRTPLIPRPIKKGARGIIEMSRKASADKRGLPDFLIIGAQKAGTTSLYRYLIQHPQILHASTKEVNYFDNHYHEGEAWYRSHFPLQARLQDGVITGEATPYYLFHPHAPRRITQLLPEAKLIVLLRNPVDRAISHYFHEVRRGVETLPIEQAMEQEEVRLAPEVARMMEDEYYRSIPLESFSYKRRGNYAEQQEAYHPYLERDRVMVLESQEFFANPAETLGGVLRFLDVEPSFRPADMAPENVGRYISKVPPSLYQDLSDFFVPHNARLFRLLGRVFAW